jgi:uncharacterized protein YecT (DUF1311 family)
MNMITNKHLKIIAFIAAFASSTVHALDNPDAPNTAEDFTQRATVIEQSIVTGDHSTGDYVKAYSEYETFLDTELNQAYSALMSELEASEKETLKASQKAWIKFRDQEFAFQTQNWTQSRFGTSSRLSIAQYRCALIKARVVQLLHYLNNY